MKTPTNRHGRLDGGVYSTGFSDKQVHCTNFFALRQSQLFCALQGYSRRVMPQVQPIVDKLRGSQHGVENSGNCGG